MIMTRETAAASTPSASNTHTSRCFLDKSRPTCNMRASLGASSDKPKAATRGGPPPSHSGRGLRGGFPLSASRRIGSVTHPEHVGADPLRPGPPGRSTSPGSVPFPQGKVAARLCEPPDRVCYPPGTRRYRPTPSRPSGPVHLALRARNTTPVHLALRRGTQRALRPPHQVAPSPIDAPTYGT